MEEVEKMEKRGKEKCPRISHWVGERIEGPHDILLGKIKGKIPLGLRNWIASKEVVMMGKKRKEETLLPTGNVLEYLTE